VCFFDRSNAGADRQRAARRPSKQPASMVCSKHELPRNDRKAGRFPRVAFPSTGPLSRHLSALVHPEATLAAMPQKGLWAGSRRQKATRQAFASEAAFLGQAGGSARAGPAREGSALEHRAVARGRFRWQQAPKRGFLCPEKKFLTMLRVCYARVRCENACLWLPKATWYLSKRFVTRHGFEFYRCARLHPRSYQLRTK
jgi:hypothetical protein